MIRVGVLGLDTTHARTFAETLARTDTASVTAVWDAGTVRDSAYVERFSDDFDATSYAEPTEMLTDVDAVMVLTVDWDTHASLAVPFLDAGVPTFVDKPVAGRLTDLETLAAAAGNAPLFGGSAVPFHPAVASLPARRSSRTLYATGVEDPFYYGAHLVDVARSLAAGDWRVVSPSPDPGKTVTVTFDETYARLRFDTPRADTKYAVLDVTDSARTALVGMDDGEKDEMYDAFVAAFLDTVERDEGDTTGLLDGASLLLAANLALALGRPVTPTSEALAEAHVDGGAFERGYAERVGTGGGLPAATVSRVSR